MILDPMNMRERAAFSLCEVALALGIVSFALIAVIGLLPVGLVSARQANQQAQAAQCLNMISACLQGATYSSGTSTALAPYNVSPALLSWNSNTAALEGQTILLDENGWPTTDQSRAAMLALVQVTPSQGFSPSRAHIAVAWPAIGASATWSGANFTLTNQRGFMESVVYIHVR
jgi:uncharacterized protein (TIGR02598 family)